MNFKTELDMMNREGAMINQGGFVGRRGEGQSFPQHGGISYHNRRNTQIVDKLSLDENIQYRNRDGEEGDHRTSVEQNAGTD